MTQQSLLCASDSLESHDLSIPGFKYVPEFLSHDNAAILECWLEARPDKEWLTDLSRRVIHYGWRYDYQARNVAPGQYLGPLPEDLGAVAKALRSATEAFAEIPNQVIVNEYEPGQGIAMHTDHPGFGPAVAMVSLGDAWSMKFFHEQTGRKESMLLEVGSALVLNGEARFQWQHGIAKRQYEREGGKRRLRKKRVSLTFRTVKPSN